MQMLYLLTYCQILSIRTILSTYQLAAPSTDCASQTTNGLSFWYKVRATDM